MADKGMAGLMVGDDLLLLVAHRLGLALRSGENSVDGLLHLRHADGGLRTPSGQQRRLIHQVGKIGTRETGGAGCQHVEVDVPSEGLACPVNLEDRSPTDPVGEINDDLAVEAPRTEPTQGRGCPDGLSRRSGSRPSGASNPSISTSS